MIRLSVSDAAILAIEDPGHGMPSEQIAAVYASTAEGTRTFRSGIGLDLIQRLCEHLGWRLSIHSTPGQGTRVMLEMKASKVETPQLPQ